MSMLSTPTPARPRMRSRRACARSSGVTVVEDRVTMASYSPRRASSASRGSVLETSSTWNPRSRRYAIPSGAMASITSTFMPRARSWAHPSAGRSVLPEEAQEVAALAEATAHDLAVAHHLARQRDHLARPEVETPVEEIQRLEDLGPRQMRVADGALLDAVPVHQDLGLEPAVALRLCVQRGARVGRGQRHLDGVRVDLPREPDGLRDGLARLAGQAQDEGAVNGDAEALGVPREAAGGVEPHPLLHVVENALVAGFVAHEEEPQPVVPQHHEGFGGHIGLGVHRPGEAEAA